MCGLCRCAGGPDDESTHQYDHHFWCLGILGTTTLAVLLSQAERPLVGAPCLFTLVYANNTAGWASVNNLRDGGARELCVRPLRVFRSGTVCPHPVSPVCLPLAVS